MSSYLNDNEGMVLTALFKESDNYGHDFGCQEDVVLPEGITPKQFSGYMSQLVQKGYVEVFPAEGVINTNGSRAPDQFMLTEKGIAKGVLLALEVK